MWPPLAIVYFLVTSTDDYLLQDVMSDSIMIKNSLNKVMILAPTVCKYLFDYDVLEK